MGSFVEDPWSPEFLAEDSRRLAEFERTRIGVPWDEIKTWMESWGTPNELPPPRPRRLWRHSMTTQDSIDGRLLALKWMVGFVLAFDIAILARVFVE
jgi:hypothetical protein